MLLKILDILRIGIVGGAFFVSYYIGFDGIYDPAAQLHSLVPVIITAIAGLSGLEGLCFGNEAAALKGYETGSNYQRQSAIAMLSYAVISLVVWFCDWGIRAELTILFAFIFFFFFSGVNHAIDAIKRKNYRWQNINRPFIVVLLILGMVYPVVMALNTMAP